MRNVRICKAVHQSNKLSVETILVKKDNMAECNIIKITIKLTVS